MQRKRTAPLAIRIASHGLSTRSTEPPRPFETGFPEQQGLIPTVPYPSALPSEGVGNRKAPQSSRRMHLIGRDEGTPHVSPQKSGSFAAWVLDAPSDFSMRLSRGTSSGAHRFERDYPASARDRRQSASRRTQVRAPRLSGTTPGKRILDAASAITTGRPGSSGIPFGCKESGRCYALLPTRR
jgi:hypothetical protein